MGTRSIVWLIAGFALGVFLVNLIAQPSMILTFICGTIASYIVKQIFGHDMDAAQSWMDRHPLPAVFWDHAKKYGQGVHLIRDPIQCPQCDTNPGQQNSL